MYPYGSNSAFLGGTVIGSILDLNRTLKDFGEVRLIDDSDRKFLTDRKLDNIDFKYQNLKFVFGY